MDPHSARTTLAGLRAAVGVLALAAPRFTGRRLGIDVDTNPAAPYLLRLFGARELYLASPFLFADPGLDEAELAARAVPVDAADALAALAAGLRGSVPWRTALPAALIAGAAVWMGNEGATRAPTPA